MRALRLCIVLCSLLPASLALAQDASIVDLQSTSDSTAKPEQHKDRPSVLISRVSFSSTPGVDSVEQDQIASLVEDRNCPANDLQVCAAERIRDAFQQHGYFKVVVQPPQISFSRVDQSEVEVSAVANPGVPYRLDQISWNGEYIFPQDKLNALQAIHSGEIFDTNKVRKTLEQLRKFYSERGYINFSAVPDTQVNDASRTISVTIDIDPGRQFRLRAIEIHDYPDADRRIMKALNASGVTLGLPYNAAALEDFFDKHADLLPPGASVEHNAELTTDNKSASVMLRLFWKGL